MIDEQLFKYWPLIKAFLMLWFMEVISVFARKKNGLKRIFRVYSSVIIQLGKFVIIHDNDI